jgi:hypothetical protein
MCLPAGTPLQQFNRNNKLELVTADDGDSYCDRCGNAASILDVDDVMKQVFKIFAATQQSERGVSSLI